MLLRTRNISEAAQIISLQYLQNKPIKILKLKHDSIKKALISHSTTSSSEPACSLLCTFVLKSATDIKNSPCLQLSGFRFTGLNIGIKYLLFSQTIRAVSRG